MRSCPSREQLASLLAQKASEIGGSEIGAHTRSCPKCRELLLAMSQEGTMGSGPEPADDGATVGQRMTLSTPAPATLADSPETVDRVNSESAGPDTIDISSRSSAVLRELRGAAPAETIQGSPLSAPPLDETGIFAPGGNSHSAIDIFAESQEATLADPGIRAEATDGGTLAGGSWAKNLPGFLTAAVAGGKNEPPDYEILGELGRGGMGIVHKARHRGLNRLVALKMIRGAYADEIQIARFKIEAEALAALRHPNILQIYDIGEFNGSPYVALELLEGGACPSGCSAKPLPPGRLPSGWSLSSWRWMRPTGPASSIAT